MRSVVVTIAGPSDRVDLSVPAETPIEKLLPSLLSLGVVEDDGESAEWSIGPVGHGALPAQSTLADCGILDGAILELRPIEPETEPEPPASGPIPHEQVVAEQEAQDLRRRAGFPLQRTAAALPERTGGAARLGSAIAAVFSSEDRKTRPLGRDAEDGPTTRPADLTNEERATPLQRARASWRESGYTHRLEEAIGAPRLRRCATIAVVSPKGGVGKTTVTSLVGSLLARIRHERIVAVDTNPDYGSLGRTLTPEHRVFVDDVMDILEHPDLTVAELDRKLGRAFDGLRVLPAPTDPQRMARLNKEAYSTVFDRLQTMVGGLVLDCGTGLQELAAEAAIEAADQIILVSDAEPSTASLVAEAAELIKRSGLPVYLVVNKMPRRNGRLDLDALSRAVRDARALVTMRARPAAASGLAAGDFSWDDAPEDWALSLRELLAVMAADWSDLDMAS